MLLTISDIVEVLDKGLTSHDKTLAIVTPLSAVKPLADMLRDKYGDQIEVFTDPGAPQTGPRAALNPTSPVGHTVFEARTIGRPLAKPGKLSVFVAQKTDYPTFPHIVNKAYWIEIGLQQSSV